MEDGIGGGRPQEGPGPGVVVVGEAKDPLLELGDGGEGAAADDFLGDDVEPDFDLVEPGGISGGEVEMVAGPGREPAPDAGVLVGAVVVDNEVDIEVRGHVGVNVLEKAQELLVAVARLALGQDLAGGNVQGGEEGGGAVADIAMRHAFDVAQSEGQEGLGALQGLGLALLVDAQDQGMVGRVEIEPDDVADLLDEEGIGGELEVLLPVGLDAERAPDALDRGLRHPGGLGHGAAGPVRGAAGGTARERLLQQPHEGVIRDGARPARPAFVVQAHEALGAEALAPPTDRLAADADPLGHRRVVQALGTQQHDAGAAHQARGQAARPGHRREFLTRILAHSQWWQRTASGHGLLLVPVDERQDTLSSSLCTRTSETQHLTHLQNLHTLVLEGTELQSLLPGLGQMHDLHTLVLRFSGLQSLPPELGQLQKLHTLDLGFNPLTSLPPELGQLQNLHTLKLPRTAFTTLPPVLFELQNLRALDLSRNYRGSLPPELARLHNLHTLNLRANRLEALPPELGRLTQLHTLGLSWNDLSSLPPELGQLQNLHSLDLSQNRLRSLPPELGRLTQLRTLDLSHNRLESLPPELGRLTQLHTLVACYNGLQFLPPKLGQLARLKTLDLSHNRLASLPSELGRLAQLETLNLSHNGLESLPSELGQLAQLKTLGLMHNQLVTLPPGFGRLSKLEILGLDGNAFTIIPAVLNELTSLTGLYTDFPEVHPWPPGDYPEELIYAGDWSGPCLFV